VRITPDEARRISAEYRPDASGHIRAAYEEISRAAHKGWTSTQLEWAWTGQLRTKVESPTPQVTEAVIKVLRADGYTVERMPDPDPGHPASKAFTKISW
jgi:hypothetical protein